MRQLSRIFSVLSIMFGIAGASLLVGQLPAKAETFSAVVTDTLKVQKTASFMKTIVNPQGHVRINDNLRVDGYVYRSGSKAFTVGDDLDVHGTLSRSKGALKIDDSIEQTGGTVSFAGNVDAASGLDVTGADLTVGSATLFSVSATTGLITTASVNGTSIADSSVTSADIAADTIVAGDIATGAVATAEILDATIVNGDLAADTIDFSGFSDAATLDAATTITFAPNANSDVNAVSLAFNNAGDTTAGTDQVMVISNALSTPQRTRCWFSIRRTPRQQEQRLWPTASSSRIPAGPPLRTRSRLAAAHRPLPMPLTSVPLALRPTFRSKTESPFPTTRTRKFPSEPQQRSRQAVL